MLNSAFERPLCVGCIIDFRVMMPFGIMYQMSDWFSLIDSLRLEIGSALLSFSIFIFLSFSSLEMKLGLCLCVLATQNC